MSKDASFGGLRMAGLAAVATLVLAGCGGTFHLPPPDTPRGTEGRGDAELEPRSGPETRSGEEVVPVEGGGEESGRD